MNDIYGILDDGFESVIRNTSIISDDINKDINKIKNSCMTINSKLNSDISFFSSKLDSLTQQFSQIEKKVNNYEAVLRGVLRNYELQGENISNAFK